MDLSDSQTKKFDDMAEQFNALTAIVVRLLFPWKFNPFGFFPDVSKWPKTKAYMYFLINPLSGFDGLSFDPNSAMMGILIPLLWYGFLYWLFNLGAALLALSMGVAPGETSTDIPQKTLYVFVVMLVLSIPIMFDVYVHILYFLFSKKHNRKYKVRWFLSFIFTMLIVAFFIKEGYNISAYVFPVQPLARIFLLISLIVFLIPASIITSAAVLLIGWRALQAFGYILHYVFLSLNDPLPFGNIKKAVFELNTSEDGNWRLVDLSLDEIVSLREWARENLAATEKKTIPLALLFAGLSIFASNQKFQDSMEKFFSYLFSGLSDFHWGQYMLSSILLIFVVGLIFSFILLFRNLIVQGIVIQACTVAVIIKNEQAKSSSNHVQKPKNIIKEVLKRLFNLFGSR